MWIMSRRLASATLTPDDYRGSATSPKAKLKFILHSEIQYYPLSTLTKFSGQGLIFGRSPLLWVAGRAIRCNLLFFRLKDEK